MYVYYLSVENIELDRSSHSMATPDVGYVRVVMCDISQSTPCVSL